MNYEVVSRVARLGANMNISPSEPFRYYKPQEYLRELEYEDGDVLNPIHLAASRIFKSTEDRSKMAPIIDLLLQHGANVLLEHRTGQPILHVLCEDDGYIEPFLDKIDVDTRDAQGNTLLLAACRRRSDFMAPDFSPATINLLLDKGARVGALNNTKQNVLHILLSNKLPHADKKVMSLDDILDIFMSKDTITNLINQSDTSGRTPLLTAAQNGHLSALFTLLSTGADLSKVDTGANNIFHFLAPSSRTQYQTPQIN